MRLEEVLALLGTGYILAGAPGCAPVPEGGEGDDPNNQPPVAVLEASAEARSEEYSVALSGCESHDAEDGTPAGYEFWLTDAAGDDIYESGRIEGCSVVVEGPATYGLEGTVVATLKTTDSDGAFDIDTQDLEFVAAGDDDDASGDDDDDTGSDVPYCDFSDAPNPIYDGPTGFVQVDVAPYCVGADFYAFETSEGQGLYTPNGVFPNMYNEAGDFTVWVTPALGDHTEPEEAELGDTYELRIRVSD